MINMDAKGREKQIIDERIKKISSLSADGTVAYPSKFTISGARVWSKDILDNFSKFEGKEAVLAGRMINKRCFGKLNFVILQDLKGSIQIVFQSEESPENVMDLFKKTDSGDIIGVKGPVVKTKTGEISVLAKELQILTKAVLPLPDKHAGLQDEEEKLRKRYLDIIMNPEVKEIFIKKQIFWSTIRNFLLKTGFLEVETPVLENSAGGASAEPFKTHHNALDIDVFLRISMGELWQKRLLVAGYEKTFEIGRQFRNEGMDMEHLQDYSQMEFYWGYANYEDGMKLVEEMYKEVTKAVLGTSKFKYKEYEVDMNKKWEKYDFETIIKEKTGVDIYKATKEEIIKKLTALGRDFDPNVDKWRLVDVLWKVCRKDLSGPGFLVGQPVELSPLAKRRKDDPRKVEQFQVILAGSEIGNGYSELNDPFDQESRFERQMELKEQGDVEAQDHDKEFIDALKYGMPPACGFGVSERLFAALMNRPLRECVVFPLMKPDNVSSDNDTKQAVLILNKDAKMEPWEKMNTLAHLGASFAARKGRSLLSCEAMETKDKHKIKLDIQHAILIKEGDTKSIAELISTVKNTNLELVEFIREMIDFASDKQLIGAVNNKNYKDIKYLGILVFGKIKEVDKLTKNFRLVK